MIEFVLARPKIVHSLLAIYWLILLAATSLPSSSVPSFSVSDKLQHFLAYGLLSLLLFFSLNSQKKFMLNKTKIIFFTILITISYAAFDELHQMLIPGRFCEFYDWVADSIGSLLGTAFGYFILSSKKK